MFLSNNATRRFSYPILKARKGVRFIAVHSSSLAAAVHPGFWDPQSTAPVMLFPPACLCNSLYRTWTRIRLNQVSVSFGARVPEPGQTTLGYSRRMRLHFGPPSHESVLSYDTIVNRKQVAVLRQGPPLSHPAEPFSGAAPRLAWRSFFCGRGHHSAVLGEFSAKHTHLKEGIACVECLPYPGMCLCLYVCMNFQ